LPATELRLEKPMKEFKRLWNKIQENGLSHYLTHPMYIMNYSKYNLHMLRERWLKKSVLIYILAVKLEPRENNSDVYIQCINSVEPMKEYAHLREIEEPSWNGNYLAELKKRFDRGDLCIAVLENGKIVSHVFASHSHCDFGVFPYSLDLPKQVVGIYDAFTLSNYRGRGLYKAAFNYCVNICYQKGFKDAWGVISSSNVHSMMVNRSLGMQKIIEVTMSQSWGLRRHTIRRLNNFIDKLPQLRKI